MAENDLFIKLEKYMWKIREVEIFGSSVKTYRSSWDWQTIIDSLSRISQE